MVMDSCIAIIPSTDLPRSLRFWAEGLGFSTAREMRDENGNLIFCMVSNGSLVFMLNRRAGNSVKPDDYEGIRLYWAPSDLEETHRHLTALGYEVSKIKRRDYGQSEFFMTDDDGFSHCFGKPIQPQP
jgi:lactoylglutathione lyase